MPEKKKTVMRPISQSQKKPVAKPDKSAAKPIAKPIAKPVAKPIPKPVAKTAAKPVAKTAAKPAAKPVAKPVVTAKKAISAPPKAKPDVKCPFGQKDLERFKNLLLDLRARLTGQVSALASESLTVADETPSEDRTDDFDREFALNVAGTVQDALFEIDEALRRILDGRYGICEISGKTIEKERLKALPYARYCVAVQADMEKGRTRYRPFGNALIQPPEREPGAAEAEEQE